MPIDLEDADWKALFPERAYLIGKTTLTIRPLALGQLGIISEQINLVKNSFEKEKITIDNWRDPKVLPKFLNVVVKKLPQLLSEMSGLSVKSIEKLPAAVAVDLASVCIDVNIDASDGLVKNLQTLTSKIGILNPQVGAKPSPSSG